MMDSKSKPFGAYALDALVGVSPSIRCMRRDVLKLARHAATVLITGPSGTGKELIARAIYAHSNRADKPFIPVDCASITGTLFASHMFGHIKGAFTGATYTALGCFRAADGGTIFLDEIGELELELQAKLLRVLQERVVVPAGSHEGVQVDVRLITATNRDLKREVAAGRFRADLYYRLNVMTITTLPLCERREDIEHLAHHVFARLAIRHGVPLKTLSPAALQLLLEYDWPGNVRELENVLEQAVLCGEGELIETDALREVLADRVFRDVQADRNDHDILDLPASDEVAMPFEKQVNWRTMATVEREHIRMTLAHTRGNQSAAARLLQIDRNLLRRKMSLYQLHSLAASGVAPRPASEGYG